MQDFFHSGLFSFHHITSHRSHYQHHTWSSIFSSASHRLDIHTNTPWVHHSSESASPYVRGPADEDQRPSPHMGEILPSSEDPRLTSRFPQNASSSVCVCVHVCVCIRLQYAIFCTFKGIHTTSALGYQLLKREIYHINPSVLYVRTKKKRESDARHAKQPQTQPDNQSINQWENKQK